MRRTTQDRQKNRRVITCITRFAWVLPVLPLLAAQTGCNTSGGLLTVTGTVTLDGEPVSEGAITFRAQQGTSGPAAGGKITDGQFTIAAAKGVMPGSYHVEISASKKTGKKVMDVPLGTMRDEIIQLIPPRYNRNTELMATVTEEGPNSFNFALVTTGE